ncbi:MAG: beta-1,6-N-acetylglucosaminyltransferase [Muribaculaceae bacterium]|nr:beta-1,6-N-acetylglucosaminyltransferase [Muribaculaceae bacterium]
MSRHAYLILAHSDPYCLKTLVSLIDDKRNDIFIIPDKKSDSSLYEDIKTVHSDIYILQDNKRIDVRWGSLSLVEAEIEGFRMVIEHGEYKYVHLLSGQDLPLKSQNHIHDYFNSLPPDTNLIGFAQGEFNKRDLENKTNYHHFFLNHYRHPNKLLRGGLKILRQTALNIQKLFNVKRKWEVKVYKGSEWVSITGAFAKHIVLREKEILNLFKGVPCADEMYKQTIIMNSDFKNTVFDIERDFGGDTRLIDWERGKPYVWHDMDFSELINSYALFARKFDSKVDMRIIDRIRKQLIAN